MPRSKTTIRRGGKKPVSSTTPRKPRGQRREMKADARRHGPALRAGRGKPMLFPGRTGAR